MRSRQRSGIGVFTVPPAMRSAGIRAPAEPEPACGQHRMQEGESQRRLDRRGAKLALDPGEDRREPDELSIGVQAEDRVDQRVPAVREREALRQPRAHLRRPDVPPRPLRVGGGRLDDLMLGPVLLVAAQLAAVVDPRRLVALPLHLVDREGAAARRAARREEVVDGQSQARFAMRRGPERRERGVEVAQVGRAQHDLGEQAGERAGLEA